MRPAYTEIDPFDLPEWLGAGADVVWAPDHGIGEGHLLAGHLSGQDDGTPVAAACDLVAIDQAYPEAVAEDALRVAVHRAWHHGQVWLAQSQDRLCVLVPGDRFTPELVLEALRRLAAAVGAEPRRYAALLRIG